MELAKETLWDKVKNSPLYILVAANGGVEQAARNLALYLAQKGKIIRFAMLVKESNPLTELKENGIEIISYSEKITWPLKLGKAGRNFRLLLLMAYFFISQKPVRLLVFTKEMILLATLIRSFFRKTFIAGTCNTFTSQHIGKNHILKRKMLYFLYNFYLNKADTIITCSEKMRSDLINNFSVQDNKVICIYDPVKKEIAESDLQKSRHEYKNILFIGRLAPVKNLPDLIKAFAIVHNNIADAHLTIVGGGECENELKAQAKETGISQFITFAGHQSDILPYYKNADVAVLCSHYEGFPMVLIEATISGVPVVSYNFQSGPDEIIINDKNGYLVKQYDVNQFAESIIKALEKKWDKEEIRKSSLKFHPDISLQNYENILYYADM